MNVINTTVTAGQNKVINLLERDWDFPISIIAKAGAGGTTKVEFSNTLTAFTTPGTAVWVDSGMTSSVNGTELIRIAPTVAVRISATVSTGTFEIVT